MIFVFSVGVTPCVKLMGGVVVVEPEEAEDLGEAEEAEDLGEAEEAEDLGEAEEAEDLGEAEEGGDSYVNESPPLGCTRWR